MGLLVLAAPAVLVLGRPTASGRRTWTVVAAAAVVYLRVVAGAMVVAVVVVTVVVKSLGIQSETQQNAGGGWCFATLSGGRESCSGFWGEMAAERLGRMALPGYRMPKSPLPSTLWAPGLLLHGPAYKSGSCLHRTRVCTGHSSIAPQCCLSSHPGMWVAMLPGRAACPVQVRPCAFLSWKISVSGLSA